jgi:hypothetical protein
MEVMPSSVPGNSSENRCSSLLCRNSKGNQLCRMSNTPDVQKLIMEETEIKARRYGVEDNSSDGDDSTFERFVLLYQADSRHLPGLSHREISIQEMARKKGTPTRMLNGWY